MLDHSIIAAGNAQWRSRLSACICVNGGRFEHKFCSCDFVGVFIDTSFCTFVLYKHVQRANNA